MNMEDLRKSHNVNRKKNYNPFLWWVKNKNVIKLFLVIFVIILTIIRPDITGLYIGKWVDSLVSSFSDNTSITTHQWVVIMGTILISVICYKLLQRRNKS